MAIAIKKVPVLKGSAAVSFEAKAQDAIAKKATINFTKQLKTATDILKKAII